MGCVREGQPDVFISYAHLDDLPDDEGIGWITRLKRHLHRELLRKLGRDFELWMDHELQIGADVHGDLDARVRSAIIVVVLSPNYLNSPWCQRELHWFLDETSQRMEGANRRIFVIEIDPLDEHQIPPALQKPLRARFWDYRADAQNEIVLLGTPKPNPIDPDHKPYYRRADRLVSGLSDALKSFKTKPQRENEAPQSATRATVFLAEATEDLDEQADFLRRGLEEAGFAVLPSETYPRDEEGFREAALADLKRSKLFVQLLGKIPGRKLTGAKGATQSYVSLQASCAQEVFLPAQVLCWRLDAPADQISDASYRTWLEDAGAYQVKLAEFKDLVLSRLEKALKPPAPSPPPTLLNKSVFVNADDPDLDAARSLGETLSRLGAWVEVRQKDKEAADPRAYLREQLSNCHAYFLVYGKTPITWVNGQFGLSRQVLANPPQRIGFALVEVPPPDQKDSLSTIPPGLVRLQGRPVPSESELEAYLRSL